MESKHVVVAVPLQATGPLGAYMMVLATIKAIQTIEFGA